MTFLSRTVLNSDLNICIIYILMIHNNIYCYKYMQMIYIKIFNLLIPLNHLSIFKIYLCNSFLLFYYVSKWR